MRRAFDSHIHLSGRRDDLLREFAKSNGLRYNLPELLATMKKNNVVHGLLLSPPLRDGSPLPNEDILELCAKSEGMLSPVLTVEPTRRQVAAAVKLAEASSGRVRGFKVRLGYVDALAGSRVFGPAYDYAESQGMPVLFHTGDTATPDGDLMASHPLTLDRLAGTRPELKMVLCHFGNPWIEDAAELVYKHPNVYADTSGLTTGGGSYAEKFAGMLARKLSEAVYFAGGAEKILFGTDYPVTTYPDAIALIESMDVSETDKDRMFWGNARRLFGP